MTPDSTTGGRRWYNGRRSDMRTLTVILLMLICAPARAGMTCEQYGAIAQETVRLRDQGASLSRLLTDLERGELKQRLTAHEFGVLKDVVRASFNRLLSPVEVVEACMQGGTLVPSR